MNGTLLQTLTIHRSDVTSCDFAPNFILVTGSSDKTVRLWDWIRGTGFVEKSVSPLLGHKYGVTYVCVSPQGCMFASASIDGTAVLWSTQSGKRIYCMTQVNGDAIRVCRFAPDSSVLVTASDNGAFCIWDLIHRSLLKTVFNHEGTTAGLAFTPDSRYLVSACSLEVLNVWNLEELLDVTTDQQCTPVAYMENVHDLGVLSLDVSPVIDFNENNAFVKSYTVATSGNENQIKTWTIKTILTPKYSNDRCSVSVSLNCVFDGHSSPVTCIKYDATGSHLISSSLDKVVKIWNDTGHCLLSLEGHSRYVNCVAFSRDGSIAVSGSNDKCVYVWDLWGNVSLNTELKRCTFENGNVTGDIQELQVVTYAENDDKEVKLLEKIDDVAEGSINTCCFWNNILAIGSGDKLVRLYEMLDNNLEELTCSPLEGHTYGVNHVEFSKDGTLLASCSLDGMTILWDPLTGNRLKSVPKNSLSVKVCRFSPDGSQLVTAGDDEKVYIWDVATMQEVRVLFGHLDAVSCADFTPDGSILATTSTNGDFMVWSATDFSNLHIQDDVHESGILSCHFSPSFEPVPNVLDKQSYLLATCGNDNIVKLWHFTTQKSGEESAPLQVKLWRSLQGHGGNVFCVRFSPTSGEVLCSTGTDRQARIWSSFSGDCLHVLDHDSIVTACAFNGECTLLSSGCLDKSLWLWNLPQQLVFQTAVANKIKCHTKPLISWNTKDVVKWLKTVDLEEIIENVRNTHLDGQKILTLTEEVICCGLDINEELTERLTQELRWLKSDEMQCKPGVTINTEIPHEFLCPITHEIMCSPVICSDGFTYEKNAITEWFLSGKFTSPMTNSVLTNLDFKPNSKLRAQICKFLYNPE